MRGRLSLRLKFAAIIIPRNGRRFRISHIRESGKISDEYSALGHAGKHIEKWYNTHITQPKGESIIAKINRCVVRNQAYRRAEFSIRQRHNERKNMDYQNPDIIPGRSHLNVHFKSCAGTYEQEFNRMVSEGVVNLRGLKPDAKVFDEFVFDVNTAYFENHGGYEYAKRFFAEAYKLAVKEAGGEEYVLSAILHADERNKALSEQLGRDVYHYHLHVVYLPVVDKEIYFKKNNKNPELAGQLREVVKQVSHSKKWPRTKDENGHWLNSYTLLQDRYFQHMREAGFEDFERGERKSTAKHLSVMEYKNKMEAERAAALDKTVQKKRAYLSTLDKKLTFVKSAEAVFSDIESMPKKTLTGNYQLSPADWETVSGLAKEGVKSRGKFVDLQSKSEAQTREIGRLKSRLAEHGDKDSTLDILEYYKARQRAPGRMAKVVAEIMQQPPEQQQGRDIAKVRRHEHLR